MTGGAAVVALARVHVAVGITDGEAEERPGEVASAETTGVPG